MLKFIASSSDFYVLETVNPVKEKFDVQICTITADLLRIKKSLDWLLEQIEAIKSIVFI